MLSTVRKSVGMAMVVGLLPISLLVTPVAAQSAPTTADMQAQTQTTSTATQMQPGTSYATAGQPSAGWVQLEAKGTNWYKFRYHYNNSDKDNEPTQAVVKLNMEVAGSVSFAVWTQGGLQNPQHNDKDKNHDNDKPQPVGYGTPLDKGALHNSDTNLNEDGKPVDYPKIDLGKDIIDTQTLVWSGGATASDTYYVIVKNNSDAPANYSISISGPDVSFPSN